MISFGVDIGGTGCKCVAFRDDGAQMALQYLEYPTPPGQTDLDPVLLRESVFEVIAGCTAQLPDPAEVAAITVSSFGESFVAVDRAGEPLGNIIMYFANAENSRFDRLVERAGAERFMRVARVLPDASYSLAKMLYTLETAPRPVWKFLLIAGYLCFCLSGETVTDYSLACRTLLFDVERRRWSEELLELCGIDRSLLPEALPTGSGAGTLRPEIARRLGLRPGVKVFIGAHDQIVNALGAGMRRAGESVDISGTCECVEPLFAAMPESLDFQRENYACVPYLQNAGYVTYAYNISGGSVVKWYRDALALHLREEAKRAGESVYDILNRVCPDGPTGLIVLPYLQGMGGTPDVLTGATGLFAGLTTRTALPDLYRAILEGLTFEMAYNLERLARYGIAPSALYACGGGARSPVWLQIKADILNRPIYPSLIGETGALGSAILGFAAVLGEKDVFALAARFSRCAEAVVPDEGRAAVYRDKYEEFKLYRSFAVELARRRRERA